MSTEIHHFPLVILQRVPAQIEAQRFLLVSQGLVIRPRIDGGKRLFPPPQTRLETGDRLMVQGPFDALRNMPELADPRGGRPPESTASVARA